MQQVPDMSVEQRLEILERMIQEVCDTMRRIELEFDLVVRYTRTSAQAAGLIERCKEDYAKLDAVWQHLIAERKKTHGL